MPRGSKGVETAGGVALPAGGVALPTGSDRRSSHRQPQPLSLAVSSSAE